MVLECLDQKKSTQYLIARELRLVSQHISPSLAQSHMLTNPPEHAASPPRTFQVRQASVIPAQLAPPNRRIRKLHSEMKK